MSKAPAFQFYAKDHIATLAMLSMEGKAAWVVLVAHCWNNDGPIDERIAEHLVGKEGLQSVRFLMTCEGGKMCFDWQEELRAKQAERRAVNSANGRLGGRGNTRKRRTKSERKANAFRNQNEKKPSRAADAVEDIEVGKERASDPKVELPFTSDEFSQAWSDWETSRREIKKPLTAMSRKAQLDKCAEWGEARAIAALKHSTAGGYQGLFEPSPAQAKAQAAQPPMTKEEAREIINKLREQHGRDFQTHHIPKHVYNAFYGRPAA